MELDTPATTGNRTPLAGALSGAASPPAAPPPGEASPVSARALAAAGETAELEALIAATGLFQEADPDAAIFTFGNPQEMPLQGLVDALRASAEPRSADWYAYKASDEAPRTFLARSLSQELGVEFEPHDVALTAGAFAAISVAFHLLTDPGDEVVIPKPGWFLYAPVLRQALAVPVEASLDPVTWDIDLDAVDAAITPRTRVVVVNSPHNPTGRVYGPEVWDALADVLERASQRIGRRIYLLSDEPYRRIRFDGTGFASPAAHYPWTLIDYSYGKVLLAPGQRLGYLALSPLMPEADRAALRAATFPVQAALGWVFPEAIMQHSVEALETVGLDVAELEAKRDLLVGALTGWGYDVVRPEGTFYLWAAAPGGDAAAFAAWLAERSVHVLPGGIFGQPAHFRLCLTATRDMIERALPAFEEAATAPWR
ncbi:aminotransferase class I/II-fold pyridoxal phosphate-dependent enzyme [Actinotalea ferrariae]|uniref:aminotransferase class I/II-fold pyridoxal phosphate-dependent enzyme n=1 Tax=Actinotalea ferrariae TaxID=1386098 RepID=UPI001C8CE976|nr:aminotransferase class I/II-fold pyridoxal phosphate-dependent enzyme [Actinotalea ferrariae]MBX9246804.1 aminotransferase class I/II-fold pyridoxal phosphate-dependent enzyme [Actinotalea ferrariae]